MGIVVVVDKFYFNRTTFSFFQQSVKLSIIIKFSILFSTEHTQCNDDTCLHGGLCIEQVGGFKCKCDIGYRGKRCQGKIQFFMSFPKRKIYQIILS